MAVVGNTLSAIGDVLNIKSTKPLVGVLSFTGYSDIVQNVTATRFFTKKFRYSTSRFLWSEWYDLNNNNVQAINSFPNKQYEPYYFEFEYTRTGSDTTGILIFEQVEVTSTILSPKVAILNESCLSFFTKDHYDSDLYEWAMSVFERVYKPGMVAAYLSRGATDQNEFNQDRDFNDFWRSVCLYFSIIINYGRKFESILQDSELLQIFLKVQGLYLTGDETLIQLQELARNLATEYSKRNRKVTQSNLIINETIPTEVLRLFNVAEGDEWYYQLLKTTESGWVLGRTSPLYKGLLGKTSLRKQYEEGFVDLNNWPLLNKLKCSIVNQNELKISQVASGTVAGIGDSLTTPISGMGIKVFSGIDYVIKFQIKQVAKINDITFGCIALNEFGEVEALEKMDGSGFSNYFFQQKSLNIAGEYYEVVGILYNRNVSNTAPSQLNLGFGSHLKMSGNIVKIIPYIVLHNSGGSSGQELYVKNVSILPLKSPYSIGLIQSSRIIYGWFLNRNLEKTGQQLYDILRQKFVSYDSAIILRLFESTNPVQQTGTWQDALSQDWQTNDSVWQW